MTVSLSSRRQRRIAITSGLILLFAASTVVAIVLWPRPPAYVPGETVAGITSALGKTIPADFPAVKLSDVTAAAGITFHHFHGVRSSQLPEDMGSGAAWADYDRDGLPDLFLANQAGPLTMSAAETAASPARCALYHNDGNGHFTDVTDKAGLGSLRGQFMAGAWGDYDNDGYRDLLLTSYGGLRLFNNIRGERFEEVTAQAGLTGFTGFWTGATWADYDRDGRLDLYVCGYVKYDPSSTGKVEMSKQFGSDVPSTINPSSYPPERNLLFHNEGGRFREVGRQAGVENPSGRSLSAAWCDFDGDGWPDLYVNNDVSMHAFYRNLGNGRFEDITVSSLACDYRGGMGIAIGDWDNGGRMDLFLTHWLAQENALYQCIPVAAKPPSGVKPVARKLQFIDISDQVGLGQSSLDYVGWGTAFLDIDNDGRLDIAIANGSTLQDAAAPSRLVPMRNQLYWNGCKSAGFMEGGASDRGFFEVEDAAGPALTRPNVGRGLAAADYDRDGRTDILITRNGDSPLLLHNDYSGTNNWIELSLEGRRSNRDAVGARVRVKSASARQIRVVGASASYLSQEDLTQTIGLGPDAQADSVEVLWPSGKRQSFGPVPARRQLRVVEGEAPVPLIPGRKLP